MVRRILARLSRTLALVGCVLGPWVPVASAGSRPAELRVVGDWSVEVRVRRWLGDRVERLEVTPAHLSEVRDERHDSIPVFNPRAGGWVKGAQLMAVRAQETTTPFLVDPESFVLRAGPGEQAALYQRGKDYEVDLNWGTFGRLEGGSIGEGQPVHASYRFAPLRLDSIVRDARGRLGIRMGQGRAAAPKPPELGRGELRVANLWIPGRVTKLTEQHLFPILETEYPEPKPQRPTQAESLLPRTLEKLRSGEPIRILAWGDSVTDGSYLEQPERNRWQAQFVARLQARFPKARIELITEAWGGRNTGSYLAQPPGSPHHYETTVLGAKPDLVVSEFVNDAGLGVEQVQTHYRRFLEDFRRVGAEWIVLTPHYVRPDWMGIDREREIDDDPRPYVAGLRKFGAENRVAVADAAKRYGRLWRQGIPYTTLMLNSINHPDAVGMGIFADALMELFPAR